MNKLIRYLRDNAWYVKVEHGRKICLRRGCMYWPQKDGLGMTIDLLTGNIITEEPFPAHTSIR